MSRDSHREIERKFLVRELPHDLATFSHSAIEQGYLATAADGVQVRLRKAGDQLSLTYKRDAKGGRIEREIAVTAAQFDVLWPATEDKRLTKTRYDVPLGNLVVEIDVYSGRHEGLVVAEVEFPSEEAARDFVPPAWLGEDVSGSARYSNVRLACA
ncbi:MAG: CYTH domain-containing protein [Verrucomicrobiota bacterium]|nr:CYTH domain-containing protein [Verrucomicrobiota bacterium]